MRWIQGKPPGKTPRVTGACFKNATVAIQAIAATASHSRTDKYRQRHNLQARLPPAYAARSPPWKTLVTLRKHSVTLISSCNKFRFGAIHKIKGLARLARKSLVLLLQDERRATAATAVPGGVRLLGRELR
ncbi:hypothetical protein CBM2589_B220107 [Cupriavidus taiwanensis]|uniref:Uncharacterized protein n=1 Tax=Cupriavidus taiwanensis TaxID=164546 RepID=A0A975WYR0_9BURK|nr:hypothetical protein CBM2589_B220107 [Cupriavidus taiwanensis]